MGDVLECLACGKRIGAGKYSVLSKPGNSECGGALVTMPKLKAERLLEKLETRHDR